jgi:tRNA-binding protein
MTPSDSPKPPAPVKPLVSIAELARIDVRAGTILAAEEVSGSRKLVRLTVDFGDHRRRILSGMRDERPDLSLLVGVQALFVVNLEPRKMAGETSEGMLFDIGYEDGILPALAVPERPVPNGSRAG